MEVLIIEDEKLAADRLSKLILEYDSTISILARLDSIQSSVDWFEKNEHPDLVFMDIELADGPSFDLFEKVDLKAPVIFTTAYTEYAIKAFKVNSIDYLLKPIGQKELTAAIDKYKNTNYQLSLKSSIKSTKAIINDEYKKRFMIKIGEHIQSIPVEDISYFYSKEKTTFVKTKDHKNFILDFSLDLVEDMISPVQFFRLNRQYIITYHSIADVISHTNSRLKVILNKCEDDDIIISREKVANFKAWLDL